MQRDHVVLEKHAFSFTVAVDIWFLFYGNMSARSDFGVRLGPSFQNYPNPVDSPVTTST